MASNAETKALWCGIGIGAAIVAVVGFFWYVIYKFDEISEKLDDLADRLTRPKPKPENAPPIDVTPEKTADVSRSTAIVPNSRMDSAQSNHSDQNGPQTSERKPFAASTDSEPGSDHSEKDSTQWHHSEDFRMVIAFGKTFSLTLYQSRVIEKLWKARKNLVPELHKDAILEGIESCSKRLRDVFKSNLEAYKALITQGQRRGIYRLNLKLEMS